MPLCMSFTETSMFIQCCKVWVNECTKKWYPLSSRGGGGSGGLCEGGPVGGGGPGQQNWQVLCSNGVIGLI